MIGIADLFAAAVVPFVVTALICWCLLQWRHSPSAVLLGFCAGFVAALLAMGIRDRFALQDVDQSSVQRWSLSIIQATGAYLRPTLARHWLFWFVLVGTLAACLIPPRPRWQLTIWWALAIAAGMRVLWGSVFLTTEWSPSEAALRIVFFATCATVLGFASPSQPTYGEESSPRSPIFGLCGFAFAIQVSSLVLALTGSKTYGEIGGAMSACLWGAALATFFARGLEVRNRRWDPVVAVVFASLLLMGICYSHMLLWQAIGLTVATWCLLFSQRITGARMRGTLVAGSICLILGIGCQAGYQFWRDTQQPANPYDMYQS